MKLAKVMPTRKELSSAVEIKKLHQENGAQNPSCNLCNEASLFMKKDNSIGTMTPYGAVIVAKVGAKENGWFATLSPKTGGDPLADFTIQLMPFIHITQFSQLVEYPQLAENYGILFSRLSRAMVQIMAEEQENFESASLTRETSVSLATYGKSTTWKEKKEHLHLKLFPFRGKQGQPATVDSSFERKKVYHDSEGEFVKMDPIRKAMLSPERKKDLAERIIALIQSREKP